MRSYRRRLGTIILFLLDIVIFVLILLAAIFVRNLLPALFPKFPAFHAEAVRLWWLFPVWSTIMIYEGAYTKKFTFWDEVKSLWKVSFFATIATLAVVSLGKLSYAASRTLILQMGLLSLGIFPPLRTSAKKWLVRIGLLTRKVLIIGTNETGKRALSALRSEPNLGYEVVGFIENKQSKNKKYIEGVKVYGYLNKVEHYIKKCDIQDVVIAAPEIDKENLFQLVSRLQHKAENVLYIPDFTGMAVIGTELRHFFHDQLLAVEIKNNLAQPLNYFVKKLFDYIVGLTLILILIIPIIIISAIIKITSHGQAIYKQQRIGKKGKPFMCYKFRTMYNDAEEKLKTILETDAGAKADWEKYWKLKNDPRITKIGKFLRTTSLDELPQIFNVLKGEMSIVGPRPYLPREWKALKEHSETIHSVQPGITGLWQVSGRSDSSHEQRLSLDSWYVRNWNLWLDIVILLKTVHVVLKREGAQ